MTSYPCFQEPPNAACPATPHYPARECTSYADWRASLILGHSLPDFGNGGQWADNARAAGFVVNGTPAVNTVMALAPNTNGAGHQGHVAWVIAVESQTVQVAEYNFLVAFGYDERDAQIAGAEFIHLPQPPAPVPLPPVKGDQPMPWFYTATNGTIYQILGNTAMPLSFSADVEVYTNKGCLLFTHTQFTANYVAEFESRLGI